MFLCSETWDDDIKFFGVSSYIDINSTKDFPHYDLT